MFIPQGEFVAYGALTVAGLSGGHAPPTLWLLDASVAAWALARVVHDVRAPAHRPLAAGGDRGRLCAGAHGRSPCWVPAAHRSPLLMLLLSLAIVAPLAPLIYQLAYQPLADASVAGAAAAVDGDASGDAGHRCW